MSMDVMGITKRDLHPYETLEYGGVATFVESAQAADLSLVF
ncbi:MAG: DsrE/DsrF/DrsH-like family protein [Deltaproteobacteria bacterium]